MAHIFRLIFSFLCGDVLLFFWKKISTITRYYHKTQTHGGIIVSS